MSRKKSDEKVSVMIPVLFDWEIFDEQEMIDGLGISWKDKVRLILHQFPVRRQRAKDKDKSEGDFDTGWTKLNSKFLESICSSYFKVLALLEKYGVIEVQRNEKGNKSCRYGKRSAKYRINPMLIFPALIIEETKFFRKEPITDTSILNAIRRNVKKQEKELKLNLEVYETIKTYTKSLRMDKLEASSIIFDIYNSGEYKGKVVNEHWVMDKMVAVEAFEDLDYYIECPYNRHHHKFSTTWKEVKGTAYFDGYKNIAHAQLDVKNMQPYLMACLFIKQFRENMEGQVHSHILNAYESTSLSENINQFCNNTSQGSLWDDMSNKLGKDRDEVKKNTLAMFYGQRLKNLERVGEYSYVADYYPDIIDFLRITKGKNFRELARSLQRVEGFVMYNRICAQIIRESEERKDVFPFTCVHDSIFFPVDKPDRQKFIERIMVEEFLKLGAPNVPEIKPTIYKR